MTRVCLVGDDDVTLQYELLSRETARDALAPYDLREPFENTVAVETVSLGAAVALLNDLNWYLVRFVDTALVMDPSISQQEWLSRDLARAIRDDEVEPEESDRFLAIYGLEYPDAGPNDSSGGDSLQEEDGATDSAGRDSAGRDSTEGDSTEGDSTEGDTTREPTQPPRLVEPMYVTRTGDLPEYDLRDVEETLVVRLTEEEFGA